MDAQRARADAVSRIEAEVSHRHHQVVLGLHSEFAAAEQRPHTHHEGVPPPCPLCPIKQASIDRLNAELGERRREATDAQQNLQEALDRADADVPLSQTLLVVVGRGSSDPDANSNVAKVTRMLVEGFGFGWGETVYSGVTFPLVEPGLRHVVRLGFRRIVVAPYFLFSGVLVSRIRQHTERVAEDHPSVEFVASSYLGDHPKVVETFRERVEDVIRGDTAMNCSLCKYRSQVLGFEQDVGQAQESHHHHVEGLAESCTLCELECTGACQPDGIPVPVHSHEHGDHAHHHPIYPHAEHPLGPRTLGSSDSLRTP